jgi:hypothetical protein
MRGTGVIRRVMFAAWVVLLSGCEQQVGRSGVSADRDSKLLSVYEPYSPAGLEITPLTHFVVTEGGGGPIIKVYVSVLDAFDCQVKSPGTFRFELYERVQTSSEPRGARIGLWPDVDLTDAVENNGYWRDFLRAYEFSLNFQPKSGHRYILEVTFLGPTGKRLSGDFALE